MLSFATTWVDLQDISLCEINQTPKEKYCIISLISGIKKKKKGQIFTEIGNKTSYEGQGCGEEMGEVSQKIQNSTYAGWTNLKISLTDNVLYSGFLLNEQVIAALDTGKMGNYVRW